MIARRCWASHGRSTRSGCVPKFEASGGAAGGSRRPGWTSVDAMDLLPLIAGEDGVIRGPAGEGRVVPVSRDDVADVLPAIVSEPGHEGTTDLPFG